MATVKVEIKGVDALLMKFNKISNLQMEHSVEEITKLVHGQAKAIAPADTGQLRGSIHMDVKKLPDKVQGRVYSNVEYAAYVEFGTGVTGNGTYPYRVKGLNLEYKEKGWAYYDEDKGEWIYTKGQAAQPYMYPAIHRGRKIMKTIMKTGIKNRLKAICKGGK